MEGQQKMDDHIDKLLNYICYWQASGESLKTFARTKTRLSQIGQEGRFRGGIVPYGYRLEKQGRFNKKNHEVNEILVDPDEAAVVRIIFEKYVYEGFGAQRLSRWLYNNGYLNRKGTNFANTTIIKMLRTSRMWAFCAVGKHAQKSFRSCKSFLWICMSGHRS